MSKSLWGFFFSGLASVVPGLAYPARAIVPTTTVSFFIQFVRFMRLLPSVLFLAWDSFVDGIRIHEVEVSLCDPGLTHLRWWEKLSRRDFAFISGELVRLPVDLPMW